MSELLVSITELATVLIDAMALVIVVFGTLEAFYRCIAHLLFHEDIGAERRAIWLRYARWLVAALTFQLAADILESAIAPDWESIGRLAAIAAIRTFLNYFLERDVEDVRERQLEKRPGAAQRERDAERA